MPGDLGREYFGGHVPEQEQYRPYFGRALDLRQIESAIVQANMGLMHRMTDLGRETISLDGDVSAFLQKRLNRVAALDWDCIPASGRELDETRAKERASEVREQLELIPNFRDRIMDLAWGNFDGRACSELEWLRRGRGWAVRDLHWIHPRRLSFGPDRDLRVIDPQKQTGNFRPVGFPVEQVPYKFVVFKPRLFGDYQEREGLCPRSLYWSFFKRLGTREQLELMEIFGKPWRILIPKLGQGQAMVPGLQNVDAYEKAFQALQMLGFHNTARMPPGVDVQIVQPQEGAGAVHNDVVKACRDVLSKLYLGGVATTDAISTGLGSTIGDVHLSEEDLIIAGDARRIAECLEDQLTDAIIVANYGPGEIAYAPRFVIRTDPPIDREKEAARVKAALESGLRIAEEEARERLGFRALRNDEPYLVRTFRELPGQAPIASTETVWPAGEAPPAGEMPDLPDVALNLPDGGGPVPPAALPAPGQPPQLPAGGDPALPATAPGANSSPAAADDGAPGRQNADRLAQQMTELGATQCAHGKKNRCPLCGVERDYSVELDESGAHVWPTAWKAIGSASKRHADEGLDALEPLDEPSPMDDDDDEEPDALPVLTTARRALARRAGKLRRLLALAPPSESGSHWHTLNREGHATAVDGEHTHWFQLPDDTLVETALGGRHQHRFSDDDQRYVFGGAHTHVLELQSAGELWTEVDGYHDHELQVTATTQSGMHGHVLVLPDGATIESLRAAELAEILEGAETGLPLTNRERQRRKLTGVGLEHVRTLSIVTLAAQPETVNGTPDTLVERGVGDFVTESAALGELIADRVEGKTSGKAIRAAIQQAAKAWDRQRFADVVERELVHAMMLGALDAAWEAENSTAVEVESFRDLYASILLKRGDPGGDTDPAFAKRPQKEAVQIFIDRKVVTRDVFDQMQAAAQRRAFTVANAATDEIARAVHRELVKQIAVGAELADFRKHALGRLSSAGWTPQNASHVETVFRTNVSTAYNSGRARQMTQPVVLALRPYWQILGVGDGPPRERLTHAKANNLVLRADDPFWRKAYPPFGYNCRHRVRSLSKAQGEAIGVTEGGTIQDLPDPGFTSGLSSLIGMPNAPVEVPEAPTPGKALDPVGAQAHLQERGAQVDEVTARQIGKVVGKVEPGDLDAFLGVEPLTALGGTPTVNVTVENNAVRFETEHETPQGGRAVMQRTFVKRGRERIVQHDKLIISDELQGRGLGKRIITDQVASYQRLGLDAIELDANWIGSYYWPKLGFDVAPGALTPLVAEFEAYLIRDGYSAEAAAAMTDGIKSARDIAITMAGDRQVGKDFLLDRGALPGLRMPLKGPQFEIMKRELGL